MSVTDDLSDGFFQKATELGTKLQCNPLDLLKVWFSESIGVFADKQNQFGAKAYGINQIAWDTLQKAGWQGTADEYLKLSAEEQLPFVAKCYINYAGKLTSAARIYQLNYLPITFNTVTTPDGVISGVNGPYAWAYKGNEWLDSPYPAKRTGVITLTSINQALDGAVSNTVIPAGRTMHLNQRWAEIVARLNAVGSKPAPPQPPASPPQPDGGKSGSLWLNRDGDLVHPDAPAGGGGPGIFRLASALGTDPSNDDLPHPWAPAARTFDPVALADANSDSDSGAG